MQAAQIADIDLPLKVLVQQCQGGGMGPEKMLLSGVGLWRLLSVPLAAMLLAVCRVVFAANVGDVHARRRKLQSHLLHCINDDSRYGQVTKPFMVCWDDIPGHTLRARHRKSVFVGLHVLRPQLTLRVIALTYLPLPRWIVESLLEA